MFRSLFILALAAFCFADAPFTVKESANQARTNEPVTCGIAFNRGEVTSLNQLSLYQGATAVPAQFSKLVQFEDGSYQWVLCDFTDNFTAGEEKSYTVKTTGPPASPSTAVSASRAGSVVTVNNGVLSFSIDTVNFTGIQSLVQGSDTLVNGTTGGIYLNDLVHGTPCWNGSVTKAGFVYLGPLRATLRVEGEFYRDTCGGMGYSYMVTAYAGSPRLRLEVQVRNSTNPDCGRMAKIQRSYVALPLAYTPAQSLNWDSSFCVWSYCASRKDVRLIDAFQDGSRGLAVTDKWAGGLYPSWLHDVKVNGAMLEAEVVKGDSICTACTTYAFNQVRLACNGYLPDSAAGGDTLYKLLDMDVKNSEFWIECYSGSKTSGDLPGLSAKLRARLVGRPDPAYLRQTRALSGGNFGTLEDEEASYTKWGWSFTAGQEPALAPDPDAAVTWEDIHGESETDDAEAMLLQWVRTGSRGFFDVGEAWARYYKTHYAWRSHGWEDNGQYSAIGGVYQNAARDEVTVPGQPGHWNEGFQFWGGKCDVDGAYSGVYCHFYGAGLLDYYCLTGDPDALEGAIDLGETAWNYKSDSYRGDTLNATGGGGRADGRMLQHLTRLYEVTRDSVWFHRMHLRSRYILLSQNMDARGFIFRFPALWSNWDETLTAQTNMSDSLKNYLTANNITVVFRNDSTIVQKGSDWWEVRMQGGSWEQTYVQTGIERYYRITGDEDARDYVIGFGNHGARNIPYKCGIVPYTISFDFPEKEMQFNAGDYTNWDPAHDVCVGSQSTVSGSLPQHSGWYTVYYPNACALAYRYTGKAALMKKAYELWNLGSKRGYQSTSYYTPENEVYTFAYHYPPKNDGLMNSDKLFYEAINHGDTVPPQAVADLSVSRNADKTGLVFAWTAPADNNGTVAEYQLKYFKGRTLVEYDGYSYRYTDSVNVPFWFARNVKGEPAPAAAGTPQGFECIGSFPEDSVFFAALCSRDSCGNLSPLSNVVRIDASIAVETPDQALLPLLLSARPNPFNPAVRLAFYPGSRTLRNVRMTVTDLAGRLVREYRFASVEPGKGVSVSWRGEDRLGRLSASGVYIVKVTAGKKLRLVKKIVMAK